MTTSRNDPTRNEFADMMTSTNKRDGGEVELLPLYAELQGHPKLEIIKHYTRANVERALAESRVLPSDMPRALTRAREWCEMYLAEKTRAERLAGALREVSRYLDPRQFPEAIRKIDAALEQEPQE